MPERINFTKTVIDVLPAAPAGTRTTYHDKKVPGLTLRVTDTGKKSFAVTKKVKGRMARLTIGPYPTITPEQARKQAQEWTGLMAQGVDPREEERRDREAGTFAALFDWYLTTHAKPRKRTWEQDQDQYRLYLQGLASRSPATISRAEVRALHQAIGSNSGPYAANRAIALVGRVYKLAQAHDLLTCANPADGIAKFPETHRERRLLPGELETFLRAVDAELNRDMADLFMLLLLTGQRLSSVRAMRWTDLDRRGGLWVIPRTKNGRPHTVAIGPAELAILERRAGGKSGPWVFPGTGKEGYIVEPKSAWARVCKRAGLADLRIHDLRRTHGSLMADAGATTKQIGLSLGHLSPLSTAIYERLTVDPLRDLKGRALARVEGHVLQREGNRASLVGDEG